MINNLNKSNSMTTNSLVFTMYTVNAYKVSPLKVAPTVSLKLIKYSSIRRLSKDRENFYKLISSLLIST